MPKWRNSISIKNYLTEDTSDEMVLNLVNLLIPQLNKILNKERKLNVIDEYLLEDFEGCIEDFKFIQDSISNNDSDEYGFDTWCEAFNSYLNQLYDIGDILTNNDGWSNREKFLWVG